ncbi:hypothetical protein NHX12_030814 [Muraenolepis orangiensis]|uniref:Uncharacterized protein n=1 Tax=Muraenolepis orangiensis TaxID=630683 RepID=A0A9Q0IM01_9TELE|nr:hypothetical protein NHX12_030814 [Muraenolepis orangiensis]
MPEMWPPLQQQQQVPVALNSHVPPTKPQKMPLPPAGLQHQHSQQPHHQPPRQPPSNGPATPDPTEPEVEGGKKQGGQKKK